MTNEAIEAAIYDPLKEIEAVANQCELSSYARSGDPSQTRGMKLEAIWAETLQKALAVIRQNAGTVDVEALKTELSGKFPMLTPAQTIDELSRRGMIKNELIKPEKVGE